eukprot:GHVS01082546.1.p1 GENE.GHVS01082546.1~~GHVS01082546.1.p1  ORF type:complete len:368 (-),score=45.40 GHVS01082546.1:155-1201(-)
MGGGGGDETKLFVGGLSQETTKESLRCHFTAHGPITDAVVMYDPTSGRSRGFGFVTFENSESITDVLATAQIVDDKEVDCKRACPREIMASRLFGQNQSFKTTKIFVGGLPDLTTGEFKEYFSKYGTVVDSVLMTDKNSSRPRGFGFITYETPEVVEEVCRKYHEHQIKEKWVEVKKAQTKEQLQPRGQTGRGAGYGGSYQSYGVPAYGGYYDGYRGQYPAFDQRRGCYGPISSYDPYSGHQAAYGYPPEGGRRGYGGRSSGYRDPYMGGYGGPMGSGSSYGPPGYASAPYGGTEGGGAQRLSASGAEHGSMEGRGRRDYYQEPVGMQSAGYGSQSGGGRGEWAYQAF